MAGRSPIVIERSKTQMQDYPGPTMPYPTRKVIKLKPKDQLFQDNDSKSSENTVTLRKKQSEGKLLDILDRQLTLQQDDECTLNKYETPFKSSRTILEPVSKRNSTNQCYQIKDITGRCRTMSTDKSINLPPLSSQNEILQVEDLQNNGRNQSMPRQANDMNKLPQNNCINMKKLVNDNSGYFLHMLRKCACFVCKCGLCKCEHSSLKWTFQGGFGTVYRSNYKKQAFDNSPKLKESIHSSLTCSKSPAHGISNYKRDFQGQEAIKVQITKIPKTIKQQEPFSGLTTYALNYKDYQGAENDRSSSKPKERYGFNFPLQSDTTYRQNYSVPTDRSGLKQDTAIELKQEIMKRQKVLPLLKGYDSKIVTEYETKYQPSNEQLEQNKRIDSKNLRPSILATPSGSNQQSYKTTFMADFAESKLFPHSNKIKHSPTKSWNVKGLTEISENTDLEGDVHRLLFQ